MKIVKVDTEVKKIALKTPFVTALRRVEDVEFVRVSIVSDNGLIGIGEAPATKAITNEGIEDILISIEIAKNYLINHDLNILLSILHTKIEIGSSAKAALDIAIVSLLAKEKKQSLGEYLGVKEKQQLHTDITISLNDKETMLDDAKVAYENGMDILKVKLGPDIAHAIDVTRKIAKELPKATLLIDANQAWDVGKSLEYIEGVKGLDIALIEQPVIAQDIFGLKQVSQRSHIPILADEAVFTLQDVKDIISTKSADMINIKLMKCGGVSKAIEILQFAREHGVKCMLGSMLEGPFSINAALHLAMAYPDVIEYIDLDSPLLYKELSSELDYKYRGNLIF